MLNTSLSPWPSFTQEEADAVSRVLLSNKVNYWTGQECREFEKEFAAFAGTKYAVALANGLVALSGALMAQYQGYADISMGIGQIVAGLASVIIGQAIFGNRPVWRAVVAVVLGSVIYRLVIQLALMVGFNPNDMKLISAVLVVAALLLPKVGAFRGPRERKRTGGSAPRQAGVEVADA